MMNDSDYIVVRHEADGEIVISHNSRSYPPEYQRLTGPEENRVIRDWLSANSLQVNAEYIYPGNLYHYQVPMPKSAWKYAVVLGF